MEKQRQPTYQRPIYMPAAVPDTEVTEPTAVPYNMIFKLKITPPDNSHNPDIRYGTGWLYRHNILVTAGHCVHESAGPMKSISVYTGQGELVATVTSEAKRFAASDEAQESEEALVDYGVILVDDLRGIGATGSHFDVQMLDDGELGERLLSLAGYPYSGGYRWGMIRGGDATPNDPPHTGRVFPSTDAGKTNFIYDLTTHTGQSGCPIWFRTPNGNFAVVGIHHGPCDSRLCKHQTDRNRATRITGSVRAGLERLVKTVSEMGKPQRLGLTP
jgi:V8-like Glu-specific endopeptidase